MPYVEPKTRKHLDNGFPPLSSGEVVYIITRLLLDYLEGKEKISYDDLNEITGILENTKLEFYRRLTSYYEDKKQADNGDVGYHDLLVQILERLRNE
jgi:hypothetical protein